MADDKKNIGPETEKLGEAPREKKVEPVNDTPPATEQPTPGTAEAPVVETAPKAQPAHSVEGQPEEKAAPAPKVLDFSAAKNKAPAKEKTAPEKKPVKEQTEEKPKRGRPAKADKAAPAEKPKQPRDKMVLLTKSRSAPPYQQKKTPSGVIRRVLSSVSGSMRSLTRGSDPPLPLSLVAKRALSCARASARKTSPRTRPAAVSAPPGIPGWNGVPGCAAGLPQSS